MARTGRPPSIMPRVAWKMYIRADIASKVELLLADPMRQKAKYGARAQLIEKLLEDWLRSQQQQAGGSS